MASANKAKELFERRKARVRRKLKSNRAGHFRLTVFRSNLHIYAQIVDDKNSKTLVSASTLNKDIAKELKTTSDIKAAQIVGKKLAELAKAANIDTVYMDRGGYLFHGRVKALADAARENGLKF